MTEFGRLSGIVRICSSHHSPGLDEVKIQTSRFYKASIDVNHDGEKHWPV